MTTEVALFIIIIFMFLYIIIKKLGWLEEDIEQLKRDQRK